MTTIVYHSADFDGIFCREIARHFLSQSRPEPSTPADTLFRGWNFGDPILESPEGDLIVMDLPLDAPFGGNLDPARTGSLVWIDHHKTAIESHAAQIPGYRIDGVAACRLAYQWFRVFPSGFPTPGQADIPPIFSLKDYADRMVPEPLAVRLAGEYDVWDHRDPDAKTLQFGLRLEEPAIDFTRLLQTGPIGKSYTRELIQKGSVAQAYSKKEDVTLINSRAFRLEWEGRVFIALNSARGNSLTFDALDTPETGHDALMLFYFNGTAWTFSLYHAKHRTDLDLSTIAKRHGGGGHRGACGFTSPSLPFANIANSLPPEPPSPTSAPRAPKDCLDIPAPTSLPDPVPSVPATSSKKPKG